VGHVHVEGVQHRDGVVGHVAEAIRDLRRSTLAHGRGDVAEARREAVEFGGQSDVAVVKANDEESTVHEALTEFDVEVDALTSEPIDEEQRFVAHATEGLEVQLDRTVSGERHGHHSLEHQTALVEIDNGSSSRSAQ